MTIAARNTLIERVILREGGVGDIGDGEGITRWGQTPGWLEEFNLPIPQSPEDAAENYAAWLHITGLDVIIGDEPDNAADFLIDFAVHSHHRTAVKVLQRVLGVQPETGNVGPKTRAAVAKVTNREWLAFAILADQNRYQGSIITDNPAKHARWAKGWANRQSAKLMQLAPAP